MADHPAVLYKRSETRHYHQVMEQLCLQAEPAASTAKILNGILKAT